MVTTTINGFTNIDITHKPKRYQKEVYNEIHADEKPESDEDKVKVLGDVPRSITLESAIRYFNNHAVGDKGQLFTRTALWLRELLEIRSRAVNTSSLGVSVEQENKK